MCSWLWLRWKRWGIRRRGSGGAERVGEEVREEAREEATMASARESTESWGMYPSKDRVISMDDLTLRGAWTR